MKVEKQ